MTATQLPIMSEIQAMAPTAAFSALQELFARAGHADMVSSKPDKVGICFLLDMAPRILSADAQNPELQTCLALCAVVDPEETTSGLCSNDCALFKKIEHTPEELKSIVSILARTKKGAEMLAPSLKRILSLLPTIAERKPIVLEVAENGAHNMAYYLGSILGKLLKADCPDVVTAVLNRAPEQLAAFLGPCLSRLGENPSAAEAIALRVAQRAPSAFLGSAHRFRNSLSEEAMSCCRAAAQNALLPTAAALQAPAL